MRKILIKSIIQAIPSVIIGGITAVIALYTNTEFFNIISDCSFLIVPALLAGFIAKEKCGSIGFIPALILGSLSQFIHLGLIGGIISGIFIGYFIELLKKIKVPIEFTSIMYLIFIPIASTLVGSLFIFYIFKIPILFLIEQANLYLNNLNDKNIIFLTFMLGGMIGADLGGPINKIAYIYGITTLEYGRYDIMGPISVAICIPPLSLGIAQFILKNRFSKMEREAGALAIFLGILGITEGALIYLTKDIKILPITVISSAIGACSAAILHVTSKAPHGGLIVLPLVNNKIEFIISIIIGSVAAFLSTATGTSVGAIVSIAPIAIGLAEKSGVSMPLILAAVMGGAMFGDNLSIISDTTIAATRTQGVEMKDKFRVNLSIALPAAILTIILLLIFGQPETITNIDILNYNLLKILPYITVLVMAISGLNVFIVLTSGIIISGLIGIVSRDFSLLSLTKEIYNGFLGMNEIFLLSLLSGGLAAMTSKAGGIQWLIEHIQKLIIGKKTAKLGIGLLVSVTDIAVANNTVAIIINGSIAKNITKKYNIDPKESAAILDIFSCIFQGLLPYGAQMLILLNFAQEKVSPLELIPLLWYQIFLFLFTIIFIRIKN